MSEAHDIRFRILDARAAIEREVGNLLGFGPTRSLTIEQEEAMQAGASAAIETWHDAKLDVPDLVPRTELERLCAKFIALHDAKDASRAH
ncbi:hypothetical protein [Heyndrickxia sporothermodurans]